MSDPDSISRKFLKYVFLVVFAFATSSGAVAVTFEQYQGMMQTDRFAKLRPSERATLAEALQALYSNDYAKSETIIRTLIETSPEIAEAWQILGLALANQDQFEDAVTALDKSAQLYTINSEPLIIKGDILIELGRFDEARAAYETAHERDPDNWRAPLNLAALAEKEGKWQQAFEIYKASIDNVPIEAFDFRLNYVRLLLLAGNQSEAMMIIEPAAAHEDATEIVLNTAARLHIDRGQDGDLIKARAYFLRMEDLGPSVTGAIGLAAIEQSQGRNKKAEELLKGAVERFPRVPSAYLALGNFLGSTKRYGEALDTYEGGLQIAPNDPELLRGASGAELRLGRTKDAIKRARSLAERPEHTASDLVWLASLLETEEGNRDETRAAYAEAIELQPDNWVALNNLASLVVDDDPAKALGLAQKAADIAPNSKNVQDTLGWAALKAGDTAKAGAIFDELHKADPDNPVLTYRLAMVRLAEGDEVEGRKLLETALAADPDFRYAENARAALNR
ncbi:tetratricopeptide repeat protein [Roseibium album]|uniref:tetratricopeptide repeat protein n=1 Tax=Roseibium album TaxID=311410 RepID=UPI00391BE612